METQPTTPQLPVFRSLDSELLATPGHGPVCSSVVEHVECIAPNATHPEAPLIEMIRKSGQVDMLVIRCACGQEYRFRCVYQPS
jgi:hypothetical protein